MKSIYRKEKTKENTRANTQQVDTHTRAHEVKRSNEIRLQMTLEEMLEGSVGQGARTTTATGTAAADKTITESGWSDDGGGGGGVGVVGRKATHN